MTGAEMLNPGHRTASSATCTTTSAGNSSKSNPNNERKTNDQHRT
jgi:hypothetical protein